MGTSHYNWRIAGIVVGVLALIYSASISFYAFELELLINHARYLIIYLSVIGLHVLSCASWLYGIAKEKPTLMELPLLWWAIHLLISASFLISFTMQYNRHENIYQYLIEYIKLICLTICYIITAKCYVSTKKQAKAKLRIHGYNVSYVAEEQNTLNAFNLENTDL